MRIILLFTMLLLAANTHASDSAASIDLTRHWVGITALCIFFVAYILVILEEQIHLRKSKPVLLAAGLIWVLIAIYTTSIGDTHSAQISIRHIFLEYAELFFFLLVAMTYINALLERGVFDALRDWLIQRGFGYRGLFWLTGILAFCLSPIADNLTTALIMSAVVLAVGQDQPKFVAVACVNIVVAANAGGAFSPFGDITTLMVWQAGILPFTTFFKLILPAMINFLIPALVMQFAIPGGRPDSRAGSITPIKQGGLVIAVLFLATIVTAVSFHNFLHLPPVFGMMTGLAYMKFYSYFLHRKGLEKVDRSDNPTSSGINDEFDVFSNIAKAEWDTLFFFYGVILAVGGLGFIGYLSVTSEFLYGELGPTVANSIVGVLSAVIDNIPVMFAVLSMRPEMNEWQWLLVTLTTGVGGSLLSIGSAAGVALMGQARGQYTFLSHLKWTPVIAVGYAAGIYVHYLVNS